MRADLGLLEALFEELGVGVLVFEQQDLGSSMVHGASGQCRGRGWRNGRMASLTKLADGGRVGHRDLPSSPPVAGQGSGNGYTAGVNGTILIVDDEREIRDLLR